LSDTRDQHEQREFRKSLMISEGNPGETRSGSEAQGYPMGTGFAVRRCGY